MKTRIITAVVGILLFTSVIATAVITDYPVILTVTLTLAGALGVYEAIVPTKLVKSKFMIIVSIIYALVMPFFYSGYIPVNHSACLVIFGVVLFVSGMFMHRTVEPREITCAFGMAVCVTYCFWAMGSLFDSNDGHGLFYLVLAFIAAWACDTGAYFSGYFFGKHKMAPTISPKKTIEGAVGGILFDVLCMFTACLVFEYMTGYNANTLLIVLVTPLLAFSGMMGDLIASYVKRASGIKDYGKIMPGHGGILDRFDSVMTVVPLMHIIITECPVIL